MRIVFFGSDEFAGVHLEALLAAGRQVIACVTGPDKPQGRGMKTAFSPIKQMALDRRLPCLQPASLKDKDTVETLKSYQADVFVVVAYGCLLTQEVLDIPKMICLNVHGSLLPKYRGAAPVNWAVLNGEAQTGVTIQKMALSLDAGDIIAQEKMAIGSDENAAELRGRMAQGGAGLLVKVLAKHPHGGLPLIPQDKAQVTYAPKLTKEMGRIDWKKTASSINNQVRGLQPWPGAYTFYNGKMLKVIKAQVTAEETGGLLPGQVVKIDKNGFYVVCADKALLMVQVQPEAGKVMPAASFVVGYKVVMGTTL